MVSSAPERKKIAACNDHKRSHTLNKLAPKELSKAYPGEVFHAERFKTKTNFLHAQ